MPSLTAESGTGTSSQTAKTGTRSKNAIDRSIGTRSSSFLPSDDDDRKSLTVGRYQFRKDGVGWECREILGKGMNRKRSYLAHLSRSVYERMLSKATTLEELEAKLIQWAEKKREEKRSG